jgi:2-oxoglutarate dehydrogenase E1 component
MHDPGCANVQYLEALLQEYLQDASRVPPQWQRYFHKLAGGNGEAAVAGQRPSFHPTSLFNPAGGALPPGGPPDAQVARLHDGTERLLRAYRERGHLAARFNPLETPQEPHPELTPQFYGLSEEDLDRPITASTECHKAVGTLRDLVAHLQRTYCGPVGVEYLHIDDIQVRNWLCDRMERSENRIELTSAGQVRIFTRLTEAVVFEEFLHKKYTGVKTFSLEGSGTGWPEKSCAPRRIRETPPLGRKWPI